jgi:CRP-like cAMP-binding protein
MSTTAKAVLRGNLLLRGLAEATLDRIAALAIRRHYPKGTTVFRQGDAGDALYAVISGQVRISAASHDGREVFLSLMEPGDTFGEIAVIDGLERTAGAVAVADSSLFLIRRSDLLALMQREPAVAVHLLQVFCRRLRWTTELIEEAAFLDLPARLARRLLRLSADSGVKGPNGTTLRLSQGELANFLSASRQVVNQHLQEWRDGGWITLARGTIVILDEEALRALSHGAAREPRDH